MRKVLFCLMAMMGVLTLSAQTSIYDFKVNDDVGQEVSLSEYKGKVIKRYESRDQVAAIEADMQLEEIK